MTGAALLEWDNGSCNFWKERVLKELEEAEEFGVGFLLKGKTREKKHKGRNSGGGKKEK